MSHQHKQLGDIMSPWSLPELLAKLHHDIEHDLSFARETMKHPVAKGDTSEKTWLGLLENYLPARYTAAGAYIVDSQGNFSQQIDIVIFDRQYSPFILNFKEKIFIPAESVYAVFEAKQALNAANITYAQKKVASVRQLHRTSLPIPHAGGTYPPKPLPHIMGGLLTLDSDWSPPFGKPCMDALAGTDKERLDLCCVAAHGLFSRGSDGWNSVLPGGKPATAFLFELIARLQSSATVPMIDVREYAKWLADDPQEIQENPQPDALTPSL